VRYIETVSRHEYFLVCEIYRLDYEWFRFNIYGPPPISSSKVIRAVLNADLPQTFTRTDTRYVCTCFNVCNLHPRWVCAIYICVKFTCNCAQFYFLPKKVVYNTLLKCSRFQSFVLTTRFARPFKTFTLAINCNIYYFMLNSTTLFIFICRFALWKLSMNRFKNKQIFKIW